MFMVSGRLTWWFVDDDLKALRKRLQSAVLAGTGPVGRPGFPRSPASDGIDRAPHNGATCPRQPFAAPRTGSAVAVQNGALETRIAPANAPDWRALPKVLLHEHLDGGLRPATLLELCRARGLAVPVDDADALAEWMRANADSGSLARYLRGFALTVEAMASAEACERIAFEAAEDARLDGCVLAEFRMAPLLLEDHGLPGEVVVEALLNGLRRSTLPSGLIVCAMRTDAPSVTLRSADLAARFRDRGVVGFDLAGAELGHPPTAHAAAFERAREAGLGLTCHAGESDSGVRVLEAAARGPTRIGHGVHIMRGATVAQTTQWIEQARTMGLHFEVCPTSNVHTGAAASLAEHPIRAMVEAGLSVSCSTDNRLMSGVTLSSELQAVHEHAGLSLAQLGGLMRDAAAASFLPAPQRAAADRAIVQGWPAA
jgi:adenosine deaminase